MRPLEVKRHMRICHKTKIVLHRISYLLMGLALISCYVTPNTTSLPPTPVLSPAAVPQKTNVSSPLPVITPSQSVAPIATNTPLSIIIPVVGVRPEQLRDTFNEARSEGRVHEAIDIMAPHESQVVAAANGKIVKLLNSEKGGITLYQLSPDQSFVFYYAHLDRYAAGITEQQEVRQGELLGYVGDTGNAQPGSYHLHFAIWQIADPKHFWNGTNLNPYDLLH